ncbi:MAG: FKBP-type peptidyl-prolyl cis-trans isomerase [Bacteroidales bacterium]|nr:FKBP-type peptidyl-prolyl cis-trans isomerase [Bacteroidales bacterium]
MKALKFILIASAALVVFACGNSNKYPAGATADQKAQIDSVTPTKAEIDSVSFLLGINYGAFLVQQGFKEDVNMSQLIAGIKDFLAAEGDMNDEGFTEQFKIDPMEMGAIIGRYMDKKSKKTLVCNKVEEEAFLAANASKEGVQTTESGLQYKIVEPGNDVRAAAADTVFLTYKGSLIDGKVFDESADTTSFPLSNVVAGFREGLQLVGEGGSAILYIPAELGYGERGQRNPYTGQYTIEGNKMLIFEVNVAKVVPAVVVAEEE